MKEIEFQHLNKIDLPLHNGEVVTVPKFIFLYCLEAEFIRKFSQQNCYRKLVFSICP